MIAKARFRNAALLAIAVFVSPLARVPGVLHPSAAAVLGTPVLTAAETLPARLSDRDFWKLVWDFSELNGNFRSDNLLSNEIWFQHGLRPLARLTRLGGAYMGVGPEQNFTYVAALKPAISFIVDVRRGNLDLQLMYKALFEISNDRADFVSRLFSRKRPGGLGPRATPVQIFQAYSGVNPTDDLYVRTLSDIRNQLITEHRFAVSNEDLNGIEFVMRAFYTLGPQIRYSPVGTVGGTIQPTYAELMAATDEVGVARGFLADDTTFAAVKDVERRNLIVPVVGNFSGPKAIRAIGRYLKDKSLTVSAFYVSNVEEYLIQDGIWNTFCANVATLPIDRTSTFIRSIRADGPSGVGTAFTSQLRPIVDEIKPCTSSRP